MTIALYSPNFHPLTGGLENVVMDLALEFSRMGHSATVITLTPNAHPDNLPFRVVRQPNSWNQLKLMRRADVVLQFNVSLKGVIPWFFSGRPLAVSLQTAHWPDWRGRLKTWVANHLSSLNIGCSHYMSSLVDRAITVPNPYNDTLFTTRVPWQERTDELVFVGRLVSDKGADLLLYALEALKTEGLEPRLTLVGQGPEKERLLQLAYHLGIERQVLFAGLQKGQNLVEVLNRHRVLVIPSIWLEPFGIVALEGLACGCLVIGSDGGGLPEAIGGLGLTFPNNQVQELAACLRRVLLHPEACRPDSEAVARHLNRHRRRVVAQSYVQALQALVSR